MANSKERVTVVDGLHVLRILFASSKYSTPAFHISPSLNGRGDSGDARYLAATANMASKRSVGTRFSPVGIAVVGILDFWRGMAVLAVPPVTVTLWSVLLLSVASDLATTLGMGLNTRRALCSGAACSGFEEMYVYGDPGECDPFQSGSGLTKASLHQNYRWRRS